MPLNGESSTKALKVITLDETGICTGSKAADSSTLSYFGWTWSLKCDEILKPANPRLLFHIFAFMTPSLLGSLHLNFFSPLLFFRHQCKCWPGFHLKDDGKTCVDIDECSTTLPCSQRCINTYGSFKCLCVDGYEPLERSPNICKAVSGWPHL